MNIKNIAGRLIICSSLMFTCAQLPAQVLEKVPETRGRDVVVEESVEQTGLRGMTMSGTSGLVTLPTPDFAEQGINIFYKSNDSKSSIVAGGTRVDLEKDEEFVGIRAKINKNLELSAGQLSYDRSSNPLMTGLNFSKDHYSFGMKYSAPIDDKQMCMGFTFAPMSAEELNLADIEQIENLRNVYMTISEKIADKFTGYMSLNSAFTKKQEIDFGNGITRKINRKDILVGALGLDYQFGDYATFFSELRIGNYRDIFKDESVRYRLHAGMRFGNDAFQLEVMGLNLTEELPVLVIGGSLDF
ncbi:MAG: hypothetical protein KKB51_03130 [Candidatus Riflebacteria bacterium]|nr:hypothetical protein [Candidatus Riflebacteria bacterium]